MSNSSRGSAARAFARRGVFGCSLLLGAVGAACGGTELINPDGEGGFSAHAGSGGSSAAAGTHAGGANTGGSSAQGGRAGAGFAGAAFAGAGGSGFAGAGTAGGGQGCTSPLACNDGNLCTVESCVSGACVYSPQNVDDGNACTVDGCDPNTGTFHIALALNDMNACTTDLCDPVFGVQHNAVPIDDMNLCTSDGCDPMSGVSHVAFNVDDNNQCTVDACNPQTGAISHNTVPIDDKNACTFDFCDPSTGLIGHQSVAVDDGNACTFDLCNQATGMVSHTPVVVDDANACTADACDPVSGAVVHQTIDCNDNNPCTADTCNAKLGCQHTGTSTFFSDDFSTANGGWTLDPSWQIASAKVSSGQVQGNADPGTDHSATSDNGIAGVYIGGNTTTPIQGPFYLTSPAINLSAAGGLVTLEFWRWLNSDYPPFMTSTIEVFDGSAWVTLFGIQGPPPLNDNSWTQIQFDVTPYKSANFRVRWSWAVIGNGVYTESSWNIDDVRVYSTGSTTCP